MEPLPTDIFVTKGLEYLLVVAFLAALIVFWRFLTRAQAPAEERRRAATGWFHFPARAWFHPGHSWALPGADGLVKVGVDDFAQKLIGVPDSVSLPEPGVRVEQGTRGLGFTFGARTIDLLSPVDGEVIRRNEAVLADPELISSDPYGAGWLFEVRPARLGSNLGNLLHEQAAESWMAATEETLRRRMAPGLGVVLQDGGVPVVGIARNVFGPGWEEIARDFLFTT